MNKILTFVILLAACQMAAAQPKQDIMICGRFEQMPEPPYSIQEYLAKNLRYPQDAVDAGIDGRVLVKFVVTETGSFDSIHLVKGLCPSLDAEALRVVSIMPPWKPGKWAGKVVRVPFRMVIPFRLE